MSGVWFNALRPGEDGRHFPDYIFIYISLNKNALISIKISLKFVPKVPINNIPTLVQIMAWRRPGGKPLSEPMIVSLLMHICVTRPQRVKSYSQYRLTGYASPVFVMVIPVLICIFASFLFHKLRKAKAPTSMCWHISPELNDIGCFTV